MIKHSFMILYEQNIEKIKTLFHAFKKFENTLKFCFLVQYIFHSQIVLTSKKHNLVDTIWIFAYS